VKIPAAFISVVVFGSHFGAVTIAEQGESLPISKPLVAISGTDSHVKKPSYDRVTTLEDWTRIWARHLGTTVDSYYRPLFEVDFDRCMLVVIFRGEKIQTRRIEIESVSENADQVVIRFWEIGYGIQLGPGEIRPPPERPYAFIVLPKNNKEIILEEKIWSKYEQAHDLPPKWKERARLK
jgi:hypothetical protein